MHIKRSLALAGLVLLLGLTASLVLAQGNVPSSEPDTEAFIEVNFLLQDSYSNVLCAAQNGDCPAEVEATVPCLIAACSHAAQTYPVSASYTTLQDAALAAQPGSLIVIMPGRYRGVQIEDTGGADGAYIHFLGWGEPGSVVVDAPAFPDVGYLRHHFYFIAAHHYIIQNIAFENAPDGAGLFFSGYFAGTGQFAHHLIVMDVYSHDNGLWGLHTTAASYLLIQDSVFTNSREEHGAYLSGSGDHMVVRRNVFQGSSSSGLQVNADPQTATGELFYWLTEATGDTCGWSEDDVDFTGAAGWQDLKDCYDSQGLPDLGELIEDGISEDLIIEQNVMTANGAGGAAGINLASVRNSIVRNNLLYGNDAGGITCWDNAYAEEKGLASSDFGCQNVTIVNNTIVDRTGNRGALILSNDARDNTVFNNIIVRGDRFDALEFIDRSGDGLQSGANYYSALNFENSSGALLLDDDPASGSITGFSVDEALANFGTPGFALWVLEDGPWPTLNPDRPDYRLVATSPLLTAGNPAYAPTLDFNGVPRTGTEIGALGAGYDSLPEGSAAAASEPAGEPAADSAAEAAAQSSAAPISPGAGGIITFALEGSGLYRLSLSDGGAPESLLPALDALAPGGEDEMITVSPDGAWYLVSSGRFDPECAGWPCLAVLTGDLGAYEALRTGGAVVHSEGGAAVASVSDGILTAPLVVFALGGGPHTLDLWATRRAADGWTTPLLLSADSPYAWNRTPALSADGSRVVFDCGDEPYSQASLCEASTDGADMRVVLTPESGGSAENALHHPGYAPDGSIVFEADWGGAERIWRLPAGSDTPALVTDAFGNDNSPCVLADGRIVSLWLDREGGPGYHEIKVMSPDGSSYFMALQDVDVFDIGLGCAG